MANDFLNALFNAISNSSGSGGNNWSDNAKKNSSVQKKNSNSSSSKNNGSSQKSQASVKSAIDTSDKSSNSASKTTTSTSTPKASSTKTTDSFSPNSTNTVDTSDLYQSTPFDITSAAQGFMDDNFGVRQANADVTKETEEFVEHNNAVLNSSTNESTNSTPSKKEIRKNEKNNDYWNLSDTDRYIKEQVALANENRDDNSKIDEATVKKIAKTHWTQDTSVNGPDAIDSAINSYDDILAKISEDSNEDSNESAKKSSDGRSTLKYVDRTKEWLDNSDVGQAYLKALPSSIQKEYKQNGAWAIIRTMEDAAYGHALDSKQYTDLMNYVDSSGGTAVQDNIDTYKDYDGKGTSIDLNGDGKLTEDEVDAWNTWSRKNNTNSDATTWYNNKANVDEQHTQAFQNLESSYIANLYANYLEGQKGPTMTSAEDGTITLSDGDNKYDLSAAQAEALNNLITKDNYKDFQAESNDALMDAEGYWTDGFQNFNNLMSADRMLNANYKKDSNGSYSVNTDRYGNLSDEAVANMINTLDGTTYGVASSADAQNYGTATDQSDPFSQIWNWAENASLANQGADTSRKLIKGTYNPDTVSDSIGKLFNSEDLSFDDVYNLMGEDGVTYQDGTGVLYTTT